ncbi:MAG: AAA family ATPase [Gemmatimonadetes bacterium]|nr:AAA family ATPase [Gemmatimonadota bacterium]MYB71378.1 AAA family ATPase [Gemmatimonadota bacterium]
MKLKSVEIENYRAIEKLELSLDPSLTVLHGDNGYGKTSVLSAIAVGLGHEGMLGPFLDVSIDFCEEDWREGAGSPRVSLTSMDGNVFERQGTRSESERKKAEEEMSAHRENLEKALVENSRAESKDMPIVALYGTDRAVSGVPESVMSPHHLPRRTPRLDALKGALSARTDFEDLFDWFYFKNYEELREQQERRDFDYPLKDLSAVRQTISSMLREVFDPRTEVNPPRFVVSWKSEQGQVEKLSLDQLSGGYRIVLALAADLARRMVQGNPHLDDPLESEAIVLIDEVELHLHPAWQQRILYDLQWTFPNAQFIVSTHSPQVLTTVEPQRIVELAREGDCIVAGAPAIATYGAEAGDVLTVVMGVNERPKNTFTEDLARYMDLVGDDKGESKEALMLRRKLERLSPNDPALDSADIEIRRNKLLKEMGRSQ